MSDCKSCGQTLPEHNANKVSIYGMFDCHLFHKFTGNSVDAVIEEWKAMCGKPNMALRSDGTKCDIGPPALCPAIVLHNKVELRRVGQMVYRVTDEDGIESYRATLLADQDITRLLSTPGEGG